MSLNLSVATIVTSQLSAAFQTIAENPLYVDKLFLLHCIYQQYNPQALDTLYLLWKGQSVELLHSLAKSLSCID